MMRMRNPHPRPLSPQGVARGANPTPSPSTGEGWGGGLPFLLTLAVAALLFFAALGRPPRAEAQITAMLPEMMRNLDYPSEFTVSKRAPLRDGKYDQRAALNDPLRPALVTYVTSVANTEYGAAILATNTGGSGVFFTLHLVRARNGVATAGPGLPLGDRVRIEKMGISDIGSLVVYLVTQGPGEAFCCGTLQEAREYLPDGNSLRLINGIDDGLPPVRPAAAPVPPRTGNLGLLDTRSPHPHPLPPQSVATGVGVEIGRVSRLTPAPFTGEGWGGGLPLLLVTATAVLILVARRVTHDAR